MKKQITKGDTLKESEAGSIAIAFPYAISVERTDVSKNGMSKGSVPPAALNYIVEVWETYDKFGVEGWNKEGLWSFYHDKDTGKVTSGLFFDYREGPFKDDYSRETLAELRAGGLSWGDINRLHYEGFSRNPGYRCLPKEELALV